MSGLEEIADWAFDNYDIDDYDDFESWYAAVDADFTSNNRLPLDEILLGDKDRLEGMFENIKGFAGERIEREERQEMNQEIADEPVVGSSREPSIEESILSFFDFFNL